MLEIANKNDIEEIVRLLNNAKKRMACDGLAQWSNQTGGYPNEQTIQNDINQKQLYKFEKKGKIAGIIAINDDFYDAYPQQVGKNQGRVFHRVAVSEEFLGQGVGKQLYNLAEQLIKEEGYTVAVVDTYSKNEKMCSLIKSCGYEKVGEFKLYNELPNWVMFMKNL